jgi:hypothetical protein
MRPLGLHFSVGGLYTLTPWPIGKSLVLQVILQVVLHQITEPFVILPHSYRGIFGTHSSVHRESLVHITEFSHSIDLLYGHKYSYGS